MTSKEKVEFMLCHYPSAVEKIRTLEDEMRRYVPMTKEDTIDMLTFRGTTDDCVRVQRDIDTDQLLRIACSYRNLCWKLNQQQLQEWTKEYSTLARQVEFLHFAIRRLPRRQRELMHILIVEGDSWTAACERLKISGATVTQLKRRAVGNMAVTLEDYYGAYGFCEDDFGGSRNDHVV